MAIVHPPDSPTVAFVLLVTGHWSPLAHLPPDSYGALTVLHIWKVYALALANLEIVSRPHSMTVNMLS